jgi:hypothetical protein
LNFVIKVNLFIKFVPTNPAPPVTMIIFFIFIF